MTRQTDPPWRPEDLAARLARTGSRAAVLSLRGETVEATSGAELLALVHGAAQAMRAAGIGPGDIVALHAANGPRWLAVGLGAAWIGAVLAPLDVMAPFAEAMEQARRAGARLVFADAEAEPPAQGPPVRPLATLEGAAEAPAPAPRTARMPVALFRTSGTTGEPKTFVLSLGNIGAGVAAIVDWGGVTAADRVLLPLPMHHVYPWITAALPALTIGATLVFPEAPAGPQIAAAMRHARPTVLIGVPRLFEAMLEGIESRIARLGRPALWLYRGLLALADFAARHGAGWLGALPLRPLRRMVGADLRLLVSGGAALKPGTERALAAFGWDLRSGYGLSETASAFTGTFLGKRPGSAGKPLAGGEVRIANPDAGGVGELLLRGPTVFAGYLDNPQANARAFDAEGFFRSGDLGRVDADGFVHVTGRAKDVIVLAGGDNLYPEDVEEKYLADPRIREIGVFERDGRLIGLVVPEAAAVAATGTLDARRAVRMALAGVARDLPSTWRLAGFAVTRSPLPRTRLGKLRRFRLPALYRRAEGGAGAEAAAPLTAAERDWIAQPPRREVWEILARHHPERSLGLDTQPQLDLGIDSFGWMTLAVEIEGATGAHLSTADIARVDTLRDLLERVSELARQPAAPGQDHAARLAADRRWLAPRGAVQRLLGGALYGVNRWLLRWFFGLRVEGAEHLPRSGAFLLCPNHASDLDPPVIAAALPPALTGRVVWAADRTRLFGTALRRALCRAVRIFPVDEAAPMVAVDLAVAALGEGDVQIWFPEGWRSPDGRLMEFGAGTGRIVARAGVPVVPAFIDGTFEALPRQRRWPRRVPLRVVFGAPVAAADLLAGAPEGEGQAAHVAEALRRRLGALAAAHGREILPPEG